MLNGGQALNVVDTSNGSWYKVTLVYNGTTYTGYVSSSFITLGKKEDSSDTEATTASAGGSDSDFEAYLTKQGFPESYKPQLRDLHALHPNWTFKAIQTGLDWNTVIDNEINKAGQIKNLVQGTSGAPHYNWRSTTVGYNIKTDKWSSYDGSNWFAASNDFVTYYLDPRTYLYERFVFAFENLSYEDTQTKSGVESILSGTFMYKSKPSGYSYTYSELIIKAGQAVGVSPYHIAIRAVSETFESNGSTSMASTCASCMSLMAAGVPLKSMVAGISCGLVTGDTDDDYVVLTDIQGLEDFFGDMDFKVTGTYKGITAIQMDIKIHGLTRPIVEEAIARTREARLYILDEVMLPAIAEPRAQVGKYAPKIISMQIDPQKIGDVVGQRGKTINAIIEQTGVKIDITDDGAVSVCGTDKAMMDKAIKYIQTIVTDYEEGQVFEGKVVSIKEFGAFLEFAPGKEGMVHISKISKERIEHVEDVLTLGDVVKVVCLGKDKMGRYSFSIKDYKEEVK